MQEQMPKREPHTVWVAFLGDLVENEVSVRPPRERMPRANLGERSDP
jgi:hypothetical protein